ncbi:Blue copper protein [Quillaja saponaria]|uniref:Blue copper protein n=1 Tax=Quillaja saponaria TaxID=32244 RepID=A0AAD7LLV4_QUISA|nr:Blue copper protein [Quillaja saponaria]
MVCCGSVGYRITSGEGGGSFDEGRVNILFSSDHDGEQCKNGQQFKIIVTRGQGLPASLKTLTENAPSPANPDAGDEESAPETVVPSNFNNPKQESDDEKDKHEDKEKASGSVSMYVNSVDKKIVLGLVFGLVYIF